LSRPIFTQALKTLPCFEMVSVMIG